MFYVVGTPAEVKHRLLREARGELAGDHRVVFAHRYVAGGTAAGMSDELELPEAEFVERIRHRLFAMHWESRGRRYGIGKEINYWLAVGLSVVVKGSRTYLQDALAAYPEMIVLWMGAGGEGSAPGSPHRGRKSRPLHEDPCAGDQAARRSTPVIYLDCKGTRVETRDRLVSVLTTSPLRS